MSTTYAQTKDLFLSFPSSSTPLPLSLLPPVALVTLVLAFLLAFLFTTLPAKGRSVPLELISGTVASGLVGVGIVALFCTVGVHV